MENKKTKKKARFIIPAAIVAAAVVSGAVFSHFGGFSTGKCADVDEYAKYAGGVSDITVPEQAHVIALGEATHGNAEFQQLKLDVFKVMVEKYGVRSFAIEGDFGGSEAVDRYINGGDGTASEAAGAIGFAIYRTEQMEQLISWMRSYNDSAKEEDKLHFYGFDMQRVKYNYKYLLEAAKACGTDVTELESIWNADEEDFSDSSDAKKRIEVLENIKAEIEKSGDAQSAEAAHFADALIQNQKLDSDNSVSRDALMAENVLWILEQEKARGSERIFVSGHNGHVEKTGGYAGMGKVMGNLLADELGDEYFSIGTDFYKTTCNVPKGDSYERTTHLFYSHDPLAKASMKCGNDVSWLDFSAVPDSSALRQQLDEAVWTGSVGEYYSPVMAFMPMMYRVWGVPTQLYDGMIFVSDAAPTDIIEITE